jgi:hypothetical protein
MTGPWEDFQAGPWTDFRRKSSPPDDWTDIRRSAQTGAVQGVRGMLDAYTAGGLPIAPKGALQGVISGLTGAAAKGLEMMGQGGVAAGVRGIPSVAAGTDYTPKTVAGGYALTGTSMIPNAIVPGSLPMKAAAVAFPALASETAGQLTKGSKWEPVARLGGGIAGGAFTPVALDLLRRPFAPRVAPTPQVRTATALGRAVQRDQMDPATVVAAARANPKAPAFQAGGENLVGLAEVGAQSPGSARALLIKSIRDNQDGVPDQIKADIGRGLGGKGDYFATLDKAREQRSALAMPYRDKAFSTPLDPVRYQQNVAPILPRVPQSALNLAEQIARREGRNPQELGFVVERMPGGGSVNVSVANPTMQTLHYIKKGLDQDLNQFRDGLGRLDLEGQPLAAATSRVRGDLGRAMRRTSDDYDSFMQTWGDESDHVEALRLGRNVFSSKPEMSFQQLKGHVDELPPAAREMYAKGVGEALIEQVRSSKGGVNTMRQLLRSEEFRDRVSLAFPSKEAYDDFVASAAKRVQEQDRNNQVIGNSRTFGRAAGAKDLEAQSNGPLDYISAGLEGPTALTGRALSKLIKTLPRKDRSVIGNPESNAALGGALTNADEMERMFQILDQIKARQAIRPLGPWTEELRRASSESWPTQ